jgi:hypothetical protein
MVVPDEYSTIFRASLSLQTSLTSSVMFPSNSPMAYYISDSSLCYMRLES